MTKASKEYGEFTDKFKVKKTTDDCYTPEPIYNAVRDWTVRTYHLEGREIVRPFWPGGDFETFDYPEGCVVIDNPPFSIYDKILKYYTAYKIPFMLFGPALTLFKRYDCTYIVCDETITYANGAKVPTSFVTNLDKEFRIICDTGLKDAISQAELEGRAKKANALVITYPQNVVSSAILGKTSRVDFRVRKSDCEFVSKVGPERTRIFGGGFLLSDRAAADRAAADRAAERERKIIELTDDEKSIIARLDHKEN